MRLDNLIVVGWRMVWEGGFWFLLKFSCCNDWWCRVTPNLIDYGTCFIYLTSISCSCSLVYVYQLSRTNVGLRSVRINFSVSISRRRKSDEVFHIWRNNSWLVLESLVDVCVEIYLPFIHLVGVTEILSY